MSAERPPDDELARLARAYNDPPDAPAEEIWVGVRRALAEEGALEPREGVTPIREGRERLRRARWLGPARWAVAAAALLILGIGLGRWSAVEGPTGAAGTTATVAGPGPRDAARPLRVAASRHLSASETFLTVVRADARSGRIDPAISRWAGSLLSETRLLLDSPVARDPEMTALLEDLELILMQVVQASESGEIDRERTRQELELLSRGIDANDMTVRIEAILPPVPDATGI
ncbi:MAG TPA: hypothetical protein VLL48_08280 [Longimicrobiales bacterium]|nr:hypothetical protein [Longimicrobiales bacterium]